jgi:sn-glycerol 3-phosphate transport system ATP-binding protein/multiple sugar transport system ATP-binding protein
VRVEIKKLHAALHATVIYVTHDQVEAMTLADQLVVLNAGKVEQKGPPLEVYAKPASRFVAGFLGSPSMNFVDARVSDDGTTVVAEGLRVPIDRHRFAELERGRKVVVGIRPHDVTVHRSNGSTQSERDEASPAEITVSVDVVEAMGFEAYAHGRVAGGAFVARLEARSEQLPRRGETLVLSVQAAHVHLFDPDTGRSLAKIDP